MNNCAGEISVFWRLSRDLSFFYGWAVLFCFVLILAFSPVRAQQSIQNSQLQGFVNRLERLQRDMLTLQQFVYRGQDRPEMVNNQTIIESPEPAVAVRSRFNQVAEDMRQLNGQVEELGFRLQQLTDGLARLRADMDLRFSQISVQQGEAVSTEKTALIENPAATEKQVNSEALSDSSGAEISTQVQDVSLPDGAPEQQYRFAFDLLRQAHYAEAESAFRQFIAAHPQNTLSGNAQYWLGETYYVRGDFQQAAVVFAEGFKKWPDNNKAPDNLLKLGLSLSTVGQKSDACGIFSALLERHAQANPIILQRARSQQKTLSCP